jgi:hypothetical protein
VWNPHVAGQEFGGCRFTNAFIRLDGLQPVKWTLLSLLRFLFFLICIIVITGHTEWQNLFRNLLTIVRRQVKGGSSTTQAGIIIPSQLILLIFLISSLPHCHFLISTSPSPSAYDVVIVVVVE